MLFVKNEPLDNGENMKLLELKSLVKLLVLVVGSVMINGCVTPYSKPATPPSLSDFSQQEINNLVIQAGRPNVPLKDNLAVNDLIGEWDLTAYYQVSSTNESTFNGAYNSMKNKTDFSLKYRYQFFENNTYRMYFNNGQSSQAGRFSYENGILILINYEQGAFRTAGKYQVFVFAENCIELKLLDYELEKAQYAKGIEEAGKKTGSKNEVLFSQYSHDANNCCHHESFYSFYDISSGCRIKMHHYIIESPRILHKSSAIPVNPPSAEEMGIGHEKPEEAYIPPVRLQPQPTQDSGTEILQAVADGINTFNQQMQQIATQYQTPPPTPRPTPAAPAQAVAPKTVTPVSKPNFKRWCPKHGEWDGRFSAGCPACIAPKFAP